MFKRVALFVAFVFAVIPTTLTFAQQPTVEAGLPKVQKSVADDTTNVDNKGVALSTLRELYILEVGAADCYFCQHIAGKHPDVEEMFRLVKGDPSPKNHYTCQMQGRGYWADVERECAEYHATARVCDTPSGEFWIELIRRQYSEGEEIEFSMIGDVWSETVFIPKPGSKAKPEWSMVGRVTTSPQE